MAAMMPHHDEPFPDDASLAASLEDFEAQEKRSPMFGIPSQHSGFRSEQDDSEAGSASHAPWSPPGFRAQARLSNASSWFRQDPYSRMPHLRPSTSPSRSRHTSPEYQDACEQDNDVTIAANIPLPPGTDSPLKGRSPEPEEPPEDMLRAFDKKPQKDNENNYIRFAMRAEVQHREPFVPFMNFIKSKIDSATKTKSSTIFSILIGLLSLSMIRVILVPPVPPPVPDLVKLSTMAKSFEPLIFYSENGYGQIIALQETSVAVWDLGESVRAANMTSAPLIVRSLDELSDTLKTLGLELTRFFADVDSDVDGILLVMDWAKRELAGLNGPGGTAISGVIFDRVHGLLNRGGLLEGPGGPTAIGKLLTDIFGASSPQRTRSMMTRTFNEFLNVLEEAINSELTHSTALFALFETIDRQFLNLQRTVVRETDTQEQLETDMLSSLWTRLIGANAAALRKYEKNKQLLSSVRSRTVSNKHLIMEHHGRLQTLKVNLETLRRKLVSPLVRRNDSVSIDNASVVEQQIRGLEGTYDYLKDVRDKQKSKLMEMVYGAKAGKTKLVGGLEGIGIEDK
ncbi:hypothetical protein LTR64_000117 [Lithohypha guttulata]|uniref:Uncharacterized protein n=1 Tax=Lithohypha guttulata TaxID=1690604 RepID=A0AAN7STU9_9EURO|nr:hypothetical protein LTR51_007479 [Lithohypha guttulata]KAK5081247.1 hypothetical protein LTR05_008041 [Lithohypha guttulata]